MSPQPIVTAYAKGKPIGQGTLSTIVNRKTGKQHSFWSNEDELKPWRNNVAMAATMALPHDYEPTLGAVGLNLVFVSPRAKSGASVDATYKITPYDLDKLCRAVFDALTGVIYLDDRQVAELHAVKVYAGVYPDAPDEGLIFRAYRL